MKYFVGLDLKSRFPKPKVGQFGRLSDQEGAYAWRQEVTDDIDRLATLTNEASEYLKKEANPFYNLRITQVVEPDPTAKPVVTDEAESSDTHTPQRRLQPRRQSGVAES
jgi:hypothetical protein